MSNFYVSTNLNPNPIFGFNLSYFLGNLPLILFCEYGPSKTSALVRVGFNLKPELLGLIFQ